jgi:hypothetical protein
MLLPCTCLDKNIFKPLHSIAYTVVQQALHRMFDKLLECFDVKELLR